MASQGQQPAGQISADGLWRWDGERWVPAGAIPGAPPSRRSSRAWIWWLAGGCAVVLVVALIGGAFAISSLVNQIQHGGISCLPSSFPAYPGNTISSEYSYFGSGVPAGDTKECRMTLESSDDVETVTAWYSSHLNSGDWTATTDTSSGAIRFHSRSKSSTAGTIELLGRGQHTEIRIVLDS